MLKLLFQNLKTDTHWIHGDPRGGTHTAPIGPRLAWAGRLERSPFGSGLRAVFRCLAGQLARTVRWNGGSALELEIVSGYCQNIATDLTYHGNGASEVCFSCKQLDHAKFQKNPWALPSDTHQTWQ